MKKVLEPKADWNAVNETYLGNELVKNTYVDILDPKDTIVAVLLNITRRSNLFFENGYVIYRTVPAEAT